MSDILRITSAVQPKNYNLTAKPIAQSDTVFDLSDLTKVAKANDRSTEFRQSENSFAGDASKAFYNIELNISKNPSFSANLLKQLTSDNFLNQIAQGGSPEVVNEFNEFAKNIFLSSDTVLDDLISQQKGITSFNGVLFDILREIYNNTKSDQLKNSIAGFLKSTFSLQTHDNVLTSLANNFKFLSQAMSPSVSLSALLNEMSEKLLSKDASINFSELKGEALKLLNQAANSLIATDEIKDMISLIKYSMSRYNDNPFSLSDSFKALLSHVSNENLKSLLSSEFDKFIQGSDFSAVSKAALLSDSDMVSNLDKLTYSLAELANENLKLIDIENLNLQLKSLAEQLTNANGERQISLESGTNSVGEILKTILSEEGSQQFNKILSTFLETKDLNMLANRLSFILNSLENQQVKNSLATILNNVLTELSKSPDVIYRQPTSMENIANFLAKALNNENISHLGIVNPNTLVQSMLTAPGVFTPLLHYVLPVQIEDLRAFGELWIDNNASENASDNEENSNHIFINIDVENIGIFELELFSHNNNLNVSLFCPKDFVKNFSNIKNVVEQIATQSGYTLKSTKVEPLIKVRTLVDVFPRIAERRAGLNVKI